MTRQLFFKLQIRVITWIDGSTGLGLVHYVGTGLRDDAFGGSMYLYGKVGYTHSIWNLRVTHLQTRPDSRYEHPMGQQNTSRYLRGNGRNQRPRICMSLI